VARLVGRPHPGRRGHGLAIAARVAEHHGGRLLTAPVSTGACLVLELPRHDPPSPPAAASALPRAPAGRR
jgi:hypothetical protein